MSFRPILRDQLVYEVCAPVPTRGDLGVELFAVDLQNAGRVIEFRESPVADLFANFARDQHKFGIYAAIDGRVVGHAWATRARSQRMVVNGYFPLLPGQALVHHCNVAVSVRGRGIFAQMVRTLSELNATDQGFLYIDTEVHNRASRQAIESMGCRFVERRRYFQVGGRLIASRLVKARAPEAIV